MKHRPEIVVGGKLYPRAAGIGEQRARPVASAPSNGRLIGAMRRHRAEHTQSYLQGCDLRRR